MPRLSRTLLAEVVGPDGRLVVVSNRGPLTFERDPLAQAGLGAARGSGGLVTALADLGRHAPVTWVSVARSEGDRLASAALGWGDAFGADERDAPGPGMAAVVATRHGGNGAPAGDVQERARSWHMGEERDADGGIHHAGGVGILSLAPVVPATPSGAMGGSTAAFDPRLGSRVLALVREHLGEQDVALRFVVLPERVRHDHYEVVANPFLWFLQHQMYALPYEPNVDAALLDAWRNGYRPANRLIADAAIEATAGTDRPTFLVQDYHLYLVPERLRERRPDATILHFTHIPWPAASIWQAIPLGMRRAVCEALLACDVVGLQTDRHASNFLETVGSAVPDARIDGDGRSIRWRGRRVRVAAYPISLDPDRLAAFARSPAVDERLGRLRSRLERAGAGQLLVRADRIEPSKNALRGFLAFDELLRRRPELRRSLRFVAVQAPTRTALPEYAQYASAVREVVARINGMAEPDDQPVWIYDGSDYAMAIAALRLADAVLVNPIVDGMNLVAKEAMLTGERSPVLILSETAGAAEQLAGDALVVAPADVVGTADALERAVRMPAGERNARARRLRQSVRDEDIGWWLGRQLRDLAAIRRGERPPSRRLRDTARLVETAVD